MRKRIRRLESNRRQKEQGSEIVELAFVVPVLCLLVVGAWDFGSAFNMKQKITNAAREGARIVVSNTITPTPSCAPGTNPPCSVTAAAEAVGQYLSNAGLSGSCLETATPSGSFPTWTWTCSSITLTINRGANSGLDAQVTLTYPISWKMQNFFQVNVIPNQISTQVSMPILTY